ncbi:MAG TPA: hypothetical protein VGK67_30620 [Myxococcales bacterium]|jgi:hypothetical protein
MNVELTKRDMELLVQSLDHCLATCNAKAHDKKAGCKDCDSAKDLNKRLKSALKKEAKA